MFSLEVKNIIEQKVKQAKALRETPFAPFHIIVTPKDLLRDCKHLDFKKLQDAKAYRKKHPTCLNPNNIKQYVIDKSQLLSCHDCPFYQKDN